MNSKICFRCNTEKTLTQFYKHPGTSDGHLGKCKECNKIDVKNNYALKHDYYKKYDVDRQRNSIKRILSHRYNGLRQRTEGRDSHKSSSRGKELLNRIEFYEWYENTKESFNNIYEHWIKNDYIPKLAPSIDRIDNSRGYTADNMQWLTRSANSSKYNK